MNARRAGTKALGTNPIRSEIGRLSAAGRRAIHVCRREPASPSARPLVAIHGGPGFTSTTLDIGMDALTDGFAVTTFDLPGCGRSSRHPGSGYPFEDYLQDLDAVVQDSTRDDVLLFGHGWGAILATAFALRSARVTGLVLVNPLRVLNETGQDSDAQHRRIDAIDPTLVEQFHGLRAAIERGRAGDLAGWDAFDHSDWPRAMFATQFAGDVPAPWSDAMRDAALGYESYDAYKGRALTDPASDWARFDLVEWAGRIRVPVLLIASDDDANYVAPVERHAAPLADAYARSTLEVMKGVGHFPFAEAPAAFAGIVSAWTASLP